MSKNWTVGFRPTAILLPLLVGLAGCGDSKPSRFYVLSPVQIEQASAVKPAAARTRSIGVGPVDIPKYLDRAPLVVFSTDNQLELNEFDRWGEPLSDSFARAMAGNLERITGVSRVELYPFMAGGRATPDYQVVVEVLQFRLGRDGRIDLQANWTIFGGEGRRNLASGSTRVERSVAPGDMNKAVNAMSSAVAMLSQEVASALNTLPAGR